MGSLSSILGPLHSDNSHFANFLWLHGIPSFYGGALFMQFAEQHKIGEFTLGYLRKAIFESGPCELTASETYNDVGLGWDAVENLEKERFYEPNEGWVWDGSMSAEGRTWGGCLESIDEMLRHGVAIPSLQDFEGIVLITETSEEIPSADYVSRVYRALGERGILERVQGVLVGRPKAWEFNDQRGADEKRIYKEAQRSAILQMVRKYNKTIPIIQNMDFGHTHPQIPLPYGQRVGIDSDKKKVVVEF